MNSLAKNSHIQVNGELARCWLDVSSKNAGVRPGSLF